MGFRAAVAPVPARRPGRPQAAGSPQAAGGRSGGGMRSASRPRCHLRLRFARLLPGPPAAWPPRLGMTCAACAGVHAGRPFDARCLRCLQAAGCRLRAGGHMWAQLIGIHEMPRHSVQARVHCIVPIQSDLDRLGPRHVRPCCRCRAVALRALSLRAPARRALYAARSARTSMRTPPERASHARSSQLAARRPRRQPRNCARPISSSDSRRHRRAPTRSPEAPYGTHTARTAHARQPGSPVAQRPAASGERQPYGSGALSAFQRAVRECARLKRTKWHAALVAAGCVRALGADNVTSKAIRAARRQNQSRTQAMHGHAGQTLEVRRPVGAAGPWAMGRQNAQNGTECTLTTHSCRRYGVIQACSTPARRPPSACPAPGIHR